MCICRRSLVTYNSRTSGKIEKDTAHAQRLLATRFVSCVGKGSKCNESGKRKHLLMFQWGTKIFRAVVNGDVEEDC